VLWSVKARRSNETLNDDLLAWLRWCAEKAVYLITMIIILRNKIQTPTFSSERYKEEEDKRETLIAFYADFLIFPQVWSLENLMEDRSLGGKPNPKENVKDSSRSPKKVKRKDTI
jgi:hypothetical protein